MQTLVANGNVVTDGGILDSDVVIENGRIAELRGSAVAANGMKRLDASGCLVLPGIVDIHGDAFERQIMPRARVHFPLDMALMDTDRQLLANGITTAFHGVTLSWEPGLRSREACQELIDAIERQRGELACDTRLHLRFETYSLDAVGDVIAWMQAGRIDLLAFNDHIEDMAGGLDKPHKLNRFTERTGLDAKGLANLVEDVRARGHEVPAAVAQLASAAQAAGVPTLSHDDETPEERRDYHALGCRIAEFPTNEPTAETARELGDAIVFGAPNVVRGGSHAGAPSATEMVRQELCSVLASDYSYPAPLHAAFKLADEGILPLEKAWALISANPAGAAGLTDRGRIAPGQRADLVMVEKQDGRRPKLRAALVAGEPVYRA